MTGWNQILDFRGIHLSRNARGYKIRGKKWQNITVKIGARVMAQM